MKMPEDEFEFLAVKILSDEATEPEKERFEQLLALDAALRERFADLDFARKILRETRPLLEAMDAPPILIPERRLHALRQTVREHFISEPPSSAFAAMLWGWLARLNRLPKL